MKDIIGSMPTLDLSTPSLALQLMSTTSPRDTSCCMARKPRCLRMRPFWAAERPEATGVNWHVAVRPGKRRALSKQTKLGPLLDKADKLKASVQPPQNTGRFSMTSGRAFSNRH